MLIAIGLIGIFCLIVVIALLTPRDEQQMKDYDQ